MTEASVRKIDLKLEQLQPGSLRHQVMLALRQFRASWVLLGQLLNNVVYGGDYKDWGYDDFEVYCARELGLKKPTVQKLMVSYNYMKRYESNRLDACTPSPDGKTGMPEIPDFQTVELLDKIRRRYDLPDEQMNDLHRRAFDGESEQPALRKEIRQYLRPAPANEEMQAGANSRRRELAAILRPARDLHRLVNDTQVIPDGLKERLEQCLVELEGLAEDA